MPLVVFCGYPSSGKSTWTHRLAEYLRNEKQKNVIVIREEELFRGEKNDILDDSRKEKELRAKLKSEAQRVLNKEDIVIIDALNYIKGYRYELFCMSKGIPTRQVTVQCEIAQEMAWDWNISRPEVEQYKRSVFDHLIQRFELPDSQNRWDSPFFSVIPGDELDLDGIYNALHFTKAPKPNLSTKTKPLSQASFISSLEKITSDIVQALLQSQKYEGALAKFKVPHSSIMISNVPVTELGSPINLAHLTRLKRQFISMTKFGSVEGNIGDAFVQYVNSQLNQDYN